MSLEEFGALLLFATAMSFTPGPNTTLSTALAANLGLRRAVGFSSNPIRWSAAVLREWLVHGKRLLWVNRVMAGLLLATAVWMVGA